MLSSEWSFNLIIIVEFKLMIRYENERGKKNQIEKLTQVQLKQ